MTTLPNMNLVLPTEGGSSDVWDTILDTLFALVDAHDHTTGKGVKVPSAALKINANVSWAFGGTSYAITDINAVDFVPVTATSVAALSSAIFVNSSDSNNLYFRNAFGTNVKITDGSTLNISITGGIGGDYASIGALFDYDDATDTYRARQQTSASVRQFAKVSAADVRLFEYFAAGATPVPANSVTLKSPAALAASYSVTFPAAVPGSAAFLQMSSTGVVSASLDLSVTDQIPAADGLAGGATTAFAATGNVFNFGNAAGTNNAVFYPIRVRAGAIITAISVKVSKTSDATNTITMELGESDGLSTFSAVAAFTATNSAAAPGTVTLSGSGSQAATAGKQYVIRVYQSDASPSGVDSTGVATVTHT